MVPGPSLLAPRKWLRVLLLILLFGGGLALRLYDLTDLPLDFHATRQMRSALIARGMYAANNPALPEWQRETAVRQWQNEGLIEPPLLEALTALTYRWAGADILWIPRLYSILFWLAGAAFLYLLARDLAGQDGAIVALMFFLFLPYGVQASRSFQPDPLLVAMLVASFWAMQRWHRNPSRGWVAAAGLLAGLAILVKAVAVFFVAGAWLGLILAGTGWKRALRDRQVWMLAFLTVLPYLCFHVYGMYISGKLASQFNLRFFPQLWLDPVFYLHWKGMIASTVRFEWFLVAFLSLWAVDSAPHRYQLAGAWAGYFLYGLALPYHISTHDYYQLPLIPLTALGLAQAARLLFERVRLDRRLMTVLALGTLLFTCTVNGWDARNTLKRDDYRHEAVFWKQLGDRLGQGKRIVGLFQHYGYGLAYWGWADVKEWMTSGDYNLLTLAGGPPDTVAAFDAATADRDYFVVTMPDELERQPKLKSLLTARFPLVESSDDWLIYDLRQPRP